MNAFLTAYSARARWKAWWLSSAVPTQSCLAKHIMRASYPHLGRLILQPIARPDFHEPHGLRESTGEVTGCLQPLCARVGI